MPRAIDDHRDAPLIIPQPITLERGRARLEPLRLDHAGALLNAASDGRLWQLWFAAAPEPDATASYVETALDGQIAGHMLPWAVRDLESGRIVGSTRYHDIAVGIERVDIGYTWYAQSLQRTSLNTLCKLMLLAHAFHALGCEAVGLRTDSFNFASQRAIERLGAKKDGVLRHHQARRDGTVRDTCVYSILYLEWPDVKRRLELSLARRQ